MEFNTDLVPEVLTDKTETKTLPCRKCKRPCIVNMFASLAKTECNTCRAEAKPTVSASPTTSAVVANLPEIDMSLEREVMTDKQPTKTVPCRQCHRACVVTVFKTPSKTLCSTCGGVKKQEQKQKVQIAAAHTINPATLDSLADGLINPAFRQIPLCPFDPEHVVELKSISHTPNYGPRHLEGYNKNGIPQYKQETGESVVYQCDECYTVISFSTMHPINLRAQNEPRNGGGFGSVLASFLGVRS